MQEVKAFIEWAREGGATMVNVKKGELAVSVTYPDFTPAPDEPKMTDAERAARDEYDHNMAQYRSSM